ncbi:hypothetical protein WMY93_022495 [Mugilogobius chulae]|uniref:DDE Tnp4 domain-containing protein n=1 Tax=Mugilogobius chulae TaxID=88201 RepID=A0AAW0NA62_9GOBI
MEKYRGRLKKDIAWRRGEEESLQVFMMRQILIGLHQSPWDTTQQQHQTSVITVSRPGKIKLQPEESALTQLCLAESDETEPTDSELLHPICKFHLLGSLEGNDMCSKEKAASVKLSERAQQEIDRLLVENLELKLQISKMEINEATFKDNDERVKFYTGLPNFMMLMSLFSCVKDHIKNPPRSKLKPFQKFILVLMKLRLNLHVQDIAHRFNIAPSTVSKCFIAVLDVMYWRMKRIIQWPEREQLHLTMPMEFRHAFGLKCAVLIDCFEIFIERPSCLEERAGTWSSYKHHNTIKILIGITPQGSISFLSECWGGRVSDKHITEHCGLLDKLIPGDMILADRGFDIQDVVGACGAEAKIPAFTKGKSQLSPLELEATRKIAHLRIHVERVIGLLRNSTQSCKPLCQWTI